MRAATNATTSDQIELFDLEITPKAEPQSAHIALVADSALVDDALSRMRLRPSSRYVYQCMWRGFLRRLGSPLAQASRADILRAMVGGGTPATVHKLYRLLLQVHAEHEDRFGISEVPAPNLPVPEAGARALHAAPDITALETGRLPASKLPGWKQDQLRFVALFLADTGARRQELVQLRREQVRLEETPCRVWLGAGRSLRCLPLRDETRRAFEKAVASSPAPASPLVLVRDAEGGPVVASSLWRMLSRAALAVGLRDVNLTTLRNARALAWHVEGESTDELQKLLGHRSAESTLQLQERMDRLSAAKGRRPATEPSRS